MISVQRALKDEPIFREVGSSSFPSANVGTHVKMKHQRDLTTSTPCGQGGKSTTLPAGGGLRLPD